MSKPIKFTPKVMLGVSKKPDITRNLKKPLSMFGAEASDEDSDNDPTVSQQSSSAGKSNRSNIGLMALKSQKSIIGDANSTSDTPDYDESVYAYDEVYDTMKQAELTQLAQRREQKEQMEGKALYMDSLLEAKRRRDQDRQRALDVLKKKQREAEGDKYAGVESFVTSGYKEQQAAIEKELAEEEAKEKARDTDKATTGGLAFYKSMLDTSEDIHSAMVEATQTKTFVPGPPKPITIDKTIAEKAQEINYASGYTKVVLNDSGEVVDDGQLLSAGLNIKKKLAISSQNEKGSKYGLESRITPTSPTKMLPKTISTFRSKSSIPQSRSRESQSRQIEEQIALQEDKKRKATESARKELIYSLKSRKTEEAVASARERYLARKQQKQE
ncbi:hypothetical protein NADFUDRAFT_52479 [Nadsonia fulvescens var. elongata DSM 6958]|uniref:Nuclear speckle splicing regulatory protein 1 N-terminal domain-containing protein n=1 Tax=Nadsonia fulvescens var. elongata DSM 6958 TaxID=857566 RepID=A0A1E3PFG6_9ASCO|nr:hypothetical protein NADFUDRAFT_52479 [Nadsonia fulvescens var. elongata DSM 6958]